MARCVIIDGAAVFYYGAASFIIMPLFVIAMY